MNLRLGRERLILSGVIAVLMVGLALWCRPVFYLNDDVTMRSILSGSYSGMPDGHAVYMQYPLTGTLSLLYRVFSKVPWLELFFAGCILFSLVEIIGSSEHKLPAACMGCVLLLPFYLYMHYTVIAAILAGTAVYTVCCRQKPAKTVLFFLFSYMVRSQVAVLSLPFMGVALLWQLVNGSRKDRGKELKKVCKVAGVLLAGLLVCAGINRLCYSSEEWQEYQKYNEYRTDLYDYTNFLSSDLYEEEYEKYGMTKEEFVVLSSYNTMLDASLDGNKMKSVAEEVGEGMQNYRKELSWVKECIRQYYYQIRYGEFPYHVLWVLGCILTVVLFVWERNWLSVGLMGCLMGGRSLIWIYLIWKGRFPERISQSLYVIELLLIAGMCLQTAGRRMKQKEGREASAPNGSIAVIKHRICLSAVVILFAGMFAVQMKETVSEVTARTVVQKEWTLLKDYCKEHPQNLYLVDVFSAVEYSGMQYEKDAENIMLMGGWMSASPLAEGRFESLGAVDAGEALYYVDTVSFVAEKEADVSWLKEYMTGRFGECELIAVGDIVCSEEKTFTEYKIETAAMQP